jgi:hypothetical protein
LQVPDGDTITINGTGNLTATAGGNAAGSGGGAGGGNGGNITVGGGTIKDTIRINIDGDTFIGDGYRDLRDFALRSE